jgi:hypothetical protein
MGVATTGAYSFINIPQVMRATPSASLNTSVGNWVIIGAGGGTTPFTSFSPSDNIQGTFVQGSIGTASGFTVGGNYAILSGSNARITLSAEL